MKPIHSKFLLLSILIFSIPACGGSFDGQWQINEEISMADCMDWTRSNAQNDGQESNAAIAEMMEGLSNTICDGFVKKMAPQIVIKNDKMTLQAFKTEAECTIYPKANIFKCDVENSTSNEGGTIEIIDGQLVWGLPPQPEKKSMKFTYDKHHKKK
ncbi:hypothetical protein N9L75_08230 [Porticoccaceae bacterium]|nr:hypothetical protein [Porticoccaceae bacterium]MDA8652543.1 hypothetical protein [Porticoccaceae bacterium]MDA8663474.1 hypothetical protein [Porticoccaceae bacterium]MDA8788830.1 hypothetical protein [Porticoccaceae bacterium]MDB2343170.1 hypothetical protein [Porticoccaceae bacterium]